MKNKMEDDLEKDTQERKEKNRKIYSIHSQKGGVGKTSIALAIAGFEAIFHKKKVLLIDADLTGTSIKEIIKTDEGGKAHFVYNYINGLILAPPGDFEEYTPLKTKKKPRKDSAPGGLSHFYYESQEDSKIYFAPSSPDYKDIMEIIPLISQEDYLHFFRHRFEDIIITAIAEDFEVIIFDLPPGFHGLSKAICNMMFDQIKAKIEREEGKIAEPTRLDSLFHALRPKAENFIESRVIFVTTSDEPDYNAIVPLFCNYMREKNQKQFFYWENEPNSEKKNRYSYKKLKGSVDFIFNKLKAAEVIVDPKKRMKKIIEDIKGRTASLENNSDIKKVSDAVIDLIESRLILLEAVSCPNIASFDMKNILPFIIKLNEIFREKGPLSEDFLGKMEGWCENIAKTLNIADLRGKNVFNPLR
jgi:cellulose biosynthesis protein BcsQ